MPREVNQPPAGTGRPKGPIGGYFRHGGHSPPNHGNLDHGPQPNLGGENTFVSTSFEEPDSSSQKQLKNKKEFDKVKPNLRKSKRTIQTFASWEIPAGRGNIEQLCPRDLKISSRVLPYGRRLKIRRPPNGEFKKMLLELIHKSKQSLTFARRLQSLLFGVMVIADWIPSDLAPYVFVHKGCVIISDVLPFRLMKRAADICLHCPSTIITHLGCMNVGL